MTVKVLKGWANCQQFLNQGEYVSMPDDMAKDLARGGIVKPEKAPDGVKVRDIADNEVVVV